MKYVILTLLLSFSFSECSEMNELQCSSNSNCEWINNVESGNCSNFNNGYSCDEMDQCSWEYGCIQWGWWYNWCYTYGYECEGGSYTIDNSYCHDNLNPPTCSEMNSIQCVSSENCQWIENLDTENCNDILDCTNGCTWQDCLEIDGCNWHFGTAYYDPSYCYGEHIINNSYCEELNTLIGDLNEDMILNILDVIIIIDIILNAESSDLADINEDGIVNILDVIELVSIITTN